MSGLDDVLARHRLIVAVGTGGVGKTTVSAALALAAARQGRRALVLTIDPARALARALGLAALGAETRVPSDVLVDAGLPATLPFSAAMLDQKQAWDAFVTRHAPSPAVAQRLFANPFYQRLSSSFAGSTEYMAIEEMCRHADSGQFDTIILDTPPSAHALDFVQAPDRIDRLLDPSLAQLFARGAWRSAGLAARLLFHRLESAASARTLADISAFFAALSAFVDAALERTHRTRALLRGGEAAFVLVAAPRQLALDETEALVDRLVAQPTPLAAVIVNRVHTVPAVTPDLSVLGDSLGASWLRHAWSDAVAEAADEGAVIAQCQQLLPRVPFVTIPEAEHDLHALTDLRALSAQIVNGSSNVR